MAIILAVGTTVSIGTLAAVKTMSAITNAAEAVATLEASHGVVENDMLFIASSGWQRLAYRVVRADSVATNDVTLEDIDTSSTTYYPAGTGAGTIQEVSSFTEITQLTRDLQISGGEQQFADTTTLSDVVDQEVPTRRSPYRVRLPIFFDASLAWVATVRNAAAATTVLPVRFVYPNGNKLYAAAYWSYQDFPTIEGETLRGSVDLAIRGTPTIYSA
jgi:hypothetical protein